MSDPAERIGHDDEDFDDVADLPDAELDKVSLEKVDRDEVDLDEADLDEADGPEAPGDGLSPVDEDFGEVLFAEQGSGWWPMLIGPVLIGAILLMEALGPGQVHWAVMIIFFIVITGPTYLFITAARTYASVELTEKTLRCGTRRINLSDIEKIYPPNTGNDYKDWEKATALGELPAVPRGRKGIGVRMVNGKLAQAWARDVDRLRTELTEAHLAVKMGLL